jgi:nucleoside-diphosphate-sugar epimerase
MSARILITGASGFVGRALVDALAGAGHRVRATTRRPGEAGFPAGVETVATHDYRQPVDWAPLLAGVDSVVHLAGIAHIGPAIGEADYDRVVHAATAELAAACSKAGVRRLVFMSSVRAQSGPAAAGVLTENDAPRPTEAYGRAKLRAEAAVRAAGVPWTILRPAMVYGAGAKGNLALLLRLADSPWPLPFAGLANQRSLVSLDNLIAAVRIGLGADAAARQLYLVADPTPVTLPQIIAALRRGLGRAPRLYRVPPAVFARTFRLIGRGDVWERIGGSLVVDPGKLIAAGWQPDADTLGTLARIAGQHARALNA